MKTIILCLLCMNILSVYSQSIERSTITSAYDSKTILTSSIGESVVDDLLGFDKALTQGFLQIESKTEENTSYLINDKKEVVVKLHPNPSIKNINITVLNNASGTIEIRVFSMEGKQVLSSSFTNVKSHKIDVTSLAKANYICEIKINNTLYYIQFTKN